MDLQWQVRHVQALERPQPGFEAAIVSMYVGVMAYPAAYVSEFPDSVLAHDHVLGPQWLDMARGFLGLLNGPAGKRLDMGTLDAGVRDAARAAGFEEEL